uniref:Uncharacterized protein n=1 Tax=Timema genevievae TaxID=629358 RepID=A0A7R9JXH1_TIMGE|nr:unnamed protein product [Timema genevievae]
MSQINSFKYQIQKLDVFRLGVPHHVTRFGGRVVQYVILAMDWIADDEHDFVEILSPPRRKSVRSPVCKTHVDALAHDPRNNIVVQRDEVEGGGWRTAVIPSRESPTNH